MITEKQFIEETGQTLRFNTWKFDKKNLKKKKKENENKKTN